MKPVRIKDIAKKAGVSVGTVDRVLHNRGEVKTETKEKVLAIAQKLNYKPNAAAQALKASSSIKIATLLPQAEENNSFWEKHPLGIKQGIEAAHPYNIEHIEYQYEMHDAEDFKKKYVEILALKPDGVILAPILKKESLLFCTQLDELKIPYAFIDTNLKETNCLSFIGEDAYQSGRVAASLIDVGTDPEKDILIINIAKDLENIQHLNSRNQGFFSYFMESGINTGLRISVEIPSTLEHEVKEILDKVFEANHNIGAVLVSSSRTHIIAKYLNNANKEGLFVVGYEVFGKNISFLKNGTINFLIGQRPIDQSEKAFKRLIDYITVQNIPEKEEYQPIDIVNAENLILF